MKTQKYYKTCNTQPFKRDLRESLENIPPKINHTFKTSLQHSSINMRQYRKKIMRFNVRFSDVFRVNKRRPATLLKRDSNTVVFLRLLPNFFKNSFYVEHLRWPHLNNYLQYWKYSPIQKFSSHFLYSPYLINFIKFI